MTVLSTTSTATPDSSTEPTAIATTPQAVDPARLVAAVAGAGRFSWLGRSLSSPLRHRWLDVDYVGLENVPTHGPVVLAANHLAFIDSMLVMYSLDRPVTFLGKAEYLENPVARRLFPGIGMLPLDRSGRNSRVTLDRVGEILADGGIIGLHPEGTRSRDGLLSRGHRGVAQIALRAGAPIVPVALLGTGEAQPVGQLVPNFRSRVEVRFGAPIGLGRWANSRRSARARQELTEEVMDSIASLSGQQRRVESPAAA
ncbi:MAG: lysophospholipid acyltransferase family protein [Acidimicrobiales bacterium]